MSKISVSLPDETVAKLNRVSKQVGYSRSALISIMLVQALDIIGDIDNPNPDPLSSDAKRWRGKSIAPLENALVTLQSQVDLFAKGISDD